jgi:hypothetical protein
MSYRLPIAHPNIGARMEARNDPRRYSIDSTALTSTLRLLQTKSRRRL